jgi:predicted metal-dependent HD superfamily phosphohydrolase
MIAQQRAMQSKLGPEAIQSLAERTFEDTWELSGLPAQHKAHIWQKIAQQHTGRAYHNIGHLLSMFEFIRRAGKSGYQLQQPAAVHWAIWFHDIIYKPGACTGAD